MSEDKDQIISDLRAELYKAHSDHDSYRAECKSLEEHLEADVKKKDTDIKRIKEESLKKEKVHAETKTKLAELEKDVDAKTKTIADLNTQLSKLQGSSDGDKIGKLQYYVNGLKAQLQASASENEAKGKQITYLTNSIEQLRAELQKKDGEGARLKYELATVASYNSRKEADKNEYINRLKAQLAQAAASTKTIESKKSPEPKKDKYPTVSSTDKAELKQLRNYNERLTGQLESLQRELTKSKDALSLSQSQKARPSKPAPEENSVDMEYFRKLERSFRELKSKYNDVSEYRKNLTRSFRELYRRHQYEISQLKDASQHQQMEQQQAVGLSSELPEYHRKEKQNNFYVLIRTKKHYISPFLEWNQRTLKMLKQTKTAFSKSLGSLKYNADWIGYDPSEVAASIVERLDVENYKQKNLPSTVILFGTKHTAKKQILVSILRQLMEKIINLSDKQEGLKLKLRAYKCKLGEPVSFSKEFEESEDLSLSGAFEEVIYLLTQNRYEPEPSSARKAKLINPTKPKPKEQLRYVSIEFNEYYKLELVTSSNCSTAGFKEHDTLQNSLQHLIYAHLPAELHCSLVSSRHVVLPITPIVQQYDGCKLSLSLINQQHNIPKREKSADQNEYLERSPVREDSMINDSVKKKMYNFEKENEQASIKIERLEQDCAYYRSRIEDFVVRIKNIISTQNKQNSYLKKSPMTLTLEKLEQSMSSILRKTSVVVGRMNASTFERERNDGYPEGEQYHEYLLEDPEEEEQAEYSVDVL